MFIDFRTAEAPSAIHCDICIIGAGAAGISVAQALIDSGLKVCVLESGGLELTPQIQALYDGKVTGLQNASPTACRLRYFGGTTNHWTGWCAPLHDIDFETRTWVRGSGWPIQKADLLPYYEQARVLCQIGNLTYEPDAHADGDHDFPDFNPEKTKIGLFRFSPPTRFGLVYRERLKAASNVSVLLYANTLTLETNARASTVKTIRLQTLEGKTGAVTARVVVLACGGMENARLLLLSNKVQRAGLGNAQGLVGRYFMQHIEAVVGRIMPTAPEVFARNFTRYSAGEADARAELHIAAQAQAKHRLLNSGFTINVNTNRGLGYKTLRTLWGSLRKGHWPNNFAESLWTVLHDLQSVGSAIYHKEEYQIDLYVRAEPLPNAESRITLGEERDAFGQAKIKVNWQLTPFDKHSITRSAHRIAEELGRLNLGRVQLARWLTQDRNVWPQPLWGGCHHMGTTRMSDTALTGVVDRNCRVHGVNNLYIAGSSVFPTASYVPPTLTIVALALRLADHLQQKLRAPS